jgi:hypothetical protein
MKTNHRREIMTVLKYVMFKVEDKGKPLLVPVLFSPRITHRAIGKIMPTLFDDVGVNGGMPASAGFVSITGAADVFGDSESLRMHSNPSDSEIIGQCSQHDIFLTAPPRYSRF